MSKTILEFARSFVSGRLAASDFANAYMEMWRIERDHNIAAQDEESIDDCLSSIFVCTDAYNPHSDRQEYELNEDQLREQVAKLISNLDAL